MRWAVVIAALALAFVPALPSAPAMHNNGECVYGSGYVHYESETVNHLPGQAVDEVVAMLPTKLNWRRIDPLIGPGYWSNWQVCTTQISMRCNVWVTDNTLVDTYIDRYISMLHVDYKRQVESYQYHHDWSCSKASITIKLEAIEGSSDPSLRLVSV